MKRMFWKIRNLLRGRTASGQRKCCVKPGNLKEHRARPDLVVNVCNTCGAKHHELSVDMGRFAATGRGV